MFVPSSSEAGVVNTPIPLIPPAAAPHENVLKSAKCLLLSFEEAIWRKLIAAGMLKTDGTLSYDAIAILSITSFPRRVAFVQLAAKYLQEKGLSEWLLDDDFDLLSDGHLPFKNENPLFTFEELNCDSYQCIVDAALKILRYVRTPVSDDDWAMTAFYLSKGFIFAGNSQEVSCISQKSLQTYSHEENAVAIAFAASSLASKAIWLPCSETDSIFLNEIYRLLFETNVSIQLVEAILCFASWVRICHLSLDWSLLSQIDISIRKQRYFMLHHRDQVFIVAMRPSYYCSMLKQASEEDLEELRTLWQILIPTGIEEKLSKSPLFSAFSNSLNIAASFSSCASQLVKHDSSFLNQVGFTCAMAQQGIYNRPFGLDPIFERLHSLQSRGCLNSLQFLSSCLNLCDPFFEKEQDLTAFILHLLNTKHRFYGRAALRSLPLDEQPAALAKLLPALLKSNLFEAACLFKAGFYLLDQKYNQDFFFSLAKRHDTEILPDLLEIGCEILPSSNLLNLEQQELLQLLKDAIARHMFDSAVQLLAATAKNLNSEIWEEAIEFLCTHLAEPIPILKAWEALYTKRAILYRPIIFDELQLLTGETIDLSENFLISLEPSQTITAILKGWCQNVNAGRQRELATEAIVALINGNDEKNLKQLFSTYHFTNENCLLSVLQEALLNHFANPLPSGQEISRVQYLMQLATSATAIPLQNKICQPLAEHIASLQKNGSRILPILGNNPLDASSKEIELLFSAFKTSCKKKQFGLQPSIRLLIGFIPVLMAIREVKEMLAARIRRCPQEDIPSYFAPILKAFGAKKEGLNFLLTLPNCSKPHILAAAREHLFPYLEKERQLEIWSEQTEDLKKLSTSMPARAKRSRSSKNTIPRHDAMLDYFSEGLEECIADGLPLVRILDVMQAAHYWPDKIIRLAADLYPVEAVFECLWKMECNAPEPLKHKTFKFLFETMLQGQLPYLRMILKDFNAWGNLFAEKDRDTLKIQYVKAILPFMGSSAVEELCTLALLRATVSSFPPAIDVHMLSLFLESNEKELIEHAYGMAIFVLSNPALTADVLENAHPLIVKMASPSEFPALERFLLFLKLAYVYFPREFEEGSKKFVYKRILELCGEKAFPEIESEEKLLPILYNYLAENPTHASVSLCEHYLLFCDSYNACSKHSLYLLLSRAKLRLPSVFNDGKCCEAALEFFEETIQSLSEDHESTNEESLKLLQLFNTTLVDAFAALSRLAIAPEQRDLFLKKFIDLFSQLETLHAQHEVKTKQFYMQGYYLSLMDQLLQSAESVFVIGFVADCFTTYLCPLHERHLEEFNKCLATCILGLFILEPVRNLVSYRQVQKLIATLQASKNGITLDTDILRLALLLEHMIAFAIGNPHPINKQITTVIFSLVNRNNPNIESCTNSFIVLRRIHLPLRPAYPNFFNKCVDAFLAMLRNISFEDAINFMQKASLEFGFTANNYQPFKEAVFANIREALKKQEASENNAVHSFILQLHAQGQLDKNSLLDCYKMYFASWKHLPVETALLNTQRFCKEFKQQHRKILAGNGQAIDFHLPYLIFMHFLNIALVNHGFSKQGPAFLFHSVNFLLDLHRNAFFEKKSELFTRSLRSLVPLISSQVESPNDLGHLTLVYNYVLENFVKLEDECLFAFFDFFNIHFASARTHSHEHLAKIQLLLTLSTVQESFENKRPFIKILNSFYAQMVRAALEESSLHIDLAALFEILQETAAPGDLILTFSFLNSCIVLLPYEEGRALLSSVIERLDDLAKTDLFDQNPSLYFRLIKLLGPCKFELIKNHLDASQDDELIGSILRYKSKKSTQAELEERAAVLTWYSEELGAISPKTVPLQCLLLANVRNHLIYHLETASNETVFSTNLELIKPLLSANAKLIKLQLEQEQGTFDYARTLFSNLFANRSVFLKPAFIKKCMELISYYTFCFQDLDILDQAMDQIRYGTNIIRTFFLKGYFNTNPDLYYELLYSFIPCQASIIQREFTLKDVNEFEDCVYARLMDHQLDENQYFLTDIAMSFKLNGLKKYFLALSHLTVQSNSARKILIGQLEELLQQYAALLQGFLKKNHQKEGFFSFYCDSIAKIINCCSILIKLQTNDGLPCNNVLSSLLFNSLAKQGFKNKAYKGKLKKYIEKYSNMLIAINHSSATQIACEMLKKLDLNNNG